MTRKASIGSRIKEYREERGMSASDLATKAGVSKSYLSELESAKEGVKKPSAELLYSIGKALGVAMSDLLGRPIITAPRSKPPASLLKFAEDNPKVPKGDIEMLTQIQFRGDPPKTAERWEFIYQAIRNSASMDS
ncbi:MAG: helix-turn-helix transcriptional regulator [Thermoleophilia bacterium]|nr:helix-turn-helix transcriptional regulator [Thermoleophilia bacterium]